MTHEPMNSSTQESGGADKNPVKSIWEHLMKHFMFRLAVLLLGFPLLFVLTIVKIAFVDSKEDASTSNVSHPATVSAGAAMSTPISSLAASGAQVHDWSTESMDSVGPMPEPVLVPATLHHIVQIDEAVVNFGIYAGASNPRITRLVKVRTDRLPWQRARIAFRRYKLADFTPALAEEAKLPYTLAGAVSLTRRDLKGAASQQSVSQDVLKSKAVCVMDFDADAAGDMKPAARPTVATGIVTSAGMVKVTRSGGKPYTAFQIVVTDGSVRAIFTGVDLQEKFNNNVFGMHDRIHIEKVREEFEVEDGGRKSKRQKNTYKIEVLEKAQN